MIRNRVRLRGSSSGGGGSPPVSLPALDPPISTALASKSYHAFGFDRMQEGYAGNSVRLKRLSDNVQADFGFDATSGIFNMSAVDTWRSIADVDVVKFYCQNGTAATFDADNTVSFVRSGVVKRFGTTQNMTTGELTRSPTLGGVGCDLAGVGAFKLNGSVMGVAANGFEAQFLHSMNTRKNVSSPDSLGSNNNTEMLFAFGTGSDNLSKLYYFSTFGWFQGTGTKPLGEFNQDIGLSPAIHKRYGQEVFGFLINATSTYMETHFAESSSLTLGTVNQTNYAAGCFDNSSFLFGAEFLNTTGDIHPSNRLNSLFGGVVLTKALTASERVQIKAKLGLIGQSHQRKSLTDIRALWDEYFVHKTINTGTGVLAGANGKSSLLYNLTGTTTLSYVDPAVGFTGVRFSSASVNNRFAANNNYYAGEITGTIASIWRQELATSNLETPFQVSSTDEATAVFTGRNLALGFDHDRPSMMMQATGANDADGVTGTRKISDGRGIGDQTSNQANGKYNRNVTANKFVYTGEIVYGYSTSQAFWTNTDGSAPFTIDAPTGHHTLSNFDFLYKNAAPLIQIGVFEAPTGYVKTDDYATIRKAKMLQARGSLYLGLLGGAIGHACSDIAINNNAAVAHGDDTAKIRSARALGDMTGSNFAMFFAKRALSRNEIEQFQLNCYKELV